MKLAVMFTTKGSEGIELNSKLNALTVLPLFYFNKFFDYNYQNHSILKKVFNFFKNFITIVLFIFSLFVRQELWLPTI